MGESYAGIYVPKLTARVVDGQADFPINLRGMALGNGYVHEKLNIDTSVRFAYGHGLIDEKIWNILKNKCCRGCIDSCDLTQLVDSCDMTPFIKKILKVQVRTLLFYGDVDLSCNFMIGQQFVAQLGLPFQLEKTPWKYNKQIAEFKTQYKGLTFITIRDDGFHS